MRTTMMLMLTLMPVIPTNQAQAGYPVLDIPDLVFDILNVIERVVITAEEIEKYYVMAQQLEHYYDQAARLADGDADINRFLIQSFEFYMQGEIISTFWQFDDPDLASFVRLYDGTQDMKHQLGQFKAKYEDLFGFEGADAWRAAEFDVDQETLDQAKKREGQIQHLRASIAQALAWVGETKYAHEEDESGYTLSHDIWTDYQSNEDDDRGRQLAYDLINGDLSVLRDVQLKRMRILQSFQTLRSLEGAQKIQQMDQAMQASQTVLQQAERTLNGFGPVSDNIFN